MVVSADLGAVEFTALSAKFGDGHIPDEFQSFTADDALVDVLPRISHSHAKIVS
jgi:hypothetical protein